MVSCIVLFKNNFTDVVEFTIVVKKILRETESLFNKCYFIDLVKKLIRKRRKF